MYTKGKGTVTVRASVMAKPLICRVHDSFSHIIQLYNLSGFNYWSHSASNSNLHRSRARIGGQGNPRLMWCDVECSLNLDVVPQKKTNSEFASQHNNVLDLYLGLGFFLNGWSTQYYFLHPKIYKKLKPNEKHFRLFIQNHSNKKFLIWFYVYILKRKKYEEKQY